MLCVGAVSDDVCCVWVQLVMMCAVSDSVWCTRL